MKKILILLSLILVFTALSACKSEPCELYINSEFNEVTMKNIYGEGRNVAAAIEKKTFATDDTNAVSFILPEKYKDYGSRIQVQTVEGGIGAYALANDYALTSLNFEPYYADLFAVIYVDKSEIDELLEWYGDYFAESKYLGYMDDKVCYLLYNESIDSKRSSGFTSDECKDWKKFLKIVSDIDSYIMLSAN